MQEWFGMISAPSLQEVWDTPSQTVSQLVARVMLNSFQHLGRLKRAKNEILKWTPEYDPGQGSG